MELPFDFSQLIGVFTAETKDHLEKLNQGIIHLEKNPDNIDMIQDLFREAHSLKGASATMGYMEIKDISHRIEDIFAAVRDRRLRFNSILADKIFLGLDAIREFLEGIIAGQEVKKDISVLLEEIKSVLSDSIKEPKKDLPDSVTKASVPQEEASTEIIAQATSSGPATPAVPIEEFIRVPLSKINTLLNLGGELVISKVKSTQKFSAFRRLIKSVKDLQQQMTSLTDQIKSQTNTKIPLEFAESLHQCNRMISLVKEEMVALSDGIVGEAIRIDPIVDELQQHIKKIRMLPCSTLFMGFPRLVRDLAREEGKEVDLKIKGDETELDKKVLEEIKEPLIHILRNAIDHGVELPEERVAQNKPRSATLQVSAFHKGANVVLEVSDDGRGLDLERIKEVAVKKGLGKIDDLNKMTEKELLNFIFMSGFSTSRFITDISGRGVGLDVVRDRIERLKGRVEIQSVKGKGTTIQMELPLTIAIIHVLLVKVQEKVFAIPLLGVDEVAKVFRKEIQTVENRMAIGLRGSTTPVVRLDAVLGIPIDHKDRDSEDEIVDVVIIDSVYGRVGFMVDGLLGKEEIYIKNLGSHIGKPRNVSGATVLGTGEITVILDPADLVQASKTSPLTANPEGKAVHHEKTKRKLLVVEDSLTTRDLMRSILSSEGYLVDVAIDGIDAMEKIARTRYDLLVSDIEMPRMNGLELCRAVKSNEAYKNIPFVFLTALSNEDEKRRGIEAGAQAYIVKSGFDQANLIDTINRLMI